MTLTANQGIHLNPTVYGAGQYVDMGTNFSLSGTDFTLEAVVMPYDVSSNYYAIVGKSDSSGSEKGFSMRITSGKPYLRVYDGTHFVTQAGITALNPFQTYHLVCTFQVSTGTVNIYNNGNFENTNTANAAFNSIDVSEPLQVGRAFNNNYYYFNGNIYLIRIYRRILSGNEINQNYQSWVQQNPTLSTRTGLAGEWLFKEGQGTTTADTSRNGNTGTLYGCRWNQEGIQEGLQFNGISDYVKANILLQISKSNDYSIETWIYSLAQNPNGFSNWGIFQNSLSATDRNGITINSVGGVSCGFWDGTSWHSVSSNNSVLNQLSHVVGINRGGVPELWVNGVKQSGTSGAMYTATDSNSLYIGRDTNSSYPDFFHGLINSVRTYSRALSPQEIKALYQGSVIYDNSLIGVWIFNSGSGSTVPDTSGKGNTGTITGGQWSVKAANRTPIGFNSGINFKGVDTGTISPGLIFYGVEFEMFYPSNQPINQAATWTILNQKGQSSTSSYWWLYSQNNNLYFQWANGSGHGANNIGAIDVDQFSKYRVIYDPVNQLVTLYKNGILNGVYTTPNSLGVPTDFSAINIGVYQGASYKTTMIIRNLKFFDQYGNQIATYFKNGSLNGVSTTATPTPKIPIR